MDRRELLKALAAVGAGLTISPALGSTLGGLPGSSGASRVSRLGGSLLLVHSDLHNHSLISGDALGPPGRALHDIRAAGIDVACMTEHAVSGKDHGEATCPDWREGGCRFITGINEGDWRAMEAIADSAYEPGAFVAFRGFEYSTPTVGHINVWFGRDFTDPAHQGALATPRALSEMDRVFPQSQPIADRFEDAPDTAQVLPFYEWLAAAPGSLPFGGGNDAVASFNHPGYFGNFSGFAFHAGAARHIVSFEAFNSISDEPDFFWYGADKGLPNPFNACLNAGWRVGFTGVSDEHSGVFGEAGKARGGLWVDAVTREGVRRAIESRRSFATLEPGLRLDATANGVPMGSRVGAAGTGEQVVVALDIDRGPDWVGKTVWVEVIGPGSDGPALLDVQPVVIPGPDGGAASFTVTPNGSWMFLRLTDPERARHPLARAPFEEHGGAFAYASPWFWG